MFFTTKKSLTLPPRPVITANLSIFVKTSCYLRIMNMYNRWYFVPMVGSTGSFSHSEMRTKSIKKIHYFSIEWQKISTVFLHWIILHYCCSYWFKRLTLFYKIKNSRDNKSFPRVTFLTG